MSDEYPYPCTVILGDNAKDLYLSITSFKTLRVLDQGLKSLENNPKLGMIYDPQYPAARLPFVCRVLYCGVHGIYYVHREAEALVEVFAIVDQRRNPLTRFIEG